MSKPGKEKFDFQQSIPFVIFLLVGGLCGFLMGRSIDALSASESAPPFPLLLVALLLIFFLAVFLQMIFHEAGHLVFGLLTGYRFSSFRIGSLMLLKENGRLRLKALSITGTGGQCLLFPPEWSEAGIPFRLYYLGGALMNFLSAVLFLALYLVCPVNALVSALFGALAITGLAIGLINAIPLRLALLDNDGKTLRSMRKNPQAVFAFYRMMQIHGQIAGGLRLKDMPDEWFSTPPEGDLQNGLIATIEVYRCNRLLDEQKIAQAAESIRALTESDAAIAGIHRSLLICDLAYCALMMGDMEAADRALNEQQRKFMQSMKHFPAILRTQYADSLLRTHDAAAAAIILAHFTRIAKKYPYPSDIESERELMHAAEACSVQL